MYKKFAVTALFAALALPSYSVYSRSDMFMGVQQDLVQQVEIARNEVNEGKPALAIARTDLVLIDQPLKVGVSYDRVPDSQRADCDRAVQAAIELWNKGLDDDQQYVLASDPSEADIHVTFKPKVYDGESAAGGLVKWRRTITYVNDEPVVATKAEVQIRTSKPHGGRMSFELMRHEASHELGHVLGLEDCPRMGEVMSPLDLRNPVDHLSSFELGAITHLREVAREVKQEALLASN
jgi:predicted Zn-dependent protease